MATPDPTTNDNRSATPEADAPAPAPAAAAQMELTFQDQQGAEIKFKLKPTTSLKKAMDAFSARTQRERHVLRFHFDGERVLDEHTPEKLEMVDGDLVEVFIEQLGGGVVGA